MNYIRSRVIPQHSTLRCRHAGRWGGVPGVRGCTTAGAESTKLESMTCTSVHVLLAAVMVMYRSSRVAPT